MSISLIRVHSAVLRCHPQQCGDVTDKCNILKCSSYTIQVAGEKRISLKVQLRSDVHVVEV